MWGWVTSGSDVEFMSRCKWEEMIFKVDMNEKEERQTHSREKQPASAGMSLAYSRRRKAIMDET